MTTSPFPVCVVDALLPRWATVSGLSQIEIVLTDGTTENQPAVFRRPLRPSDPRVSISTFPTSWEPDMLEMTGSMRPPTLSTYHYALQLLVKHTDEEEGMTLHSLISKLMLAMLYGDTTTKVALTELVEVSLGITERTQRYGVQSQRYVNNEIDGIFVFLSTTELWVQTESV